MKILRRRPRACLLAIAAVALGGATFTTGARVGPKLGRKAAVVRIAYNDLTNSDIPLDLPVTASIGVLSEPRP